MLYILIQAITNSAKFEQALDSLGIGDAFSGSLLQETVDCLVKLNCKIDHRLRPGLICPNGDQVFGFLVRGQKLLHTVRSRLMFKSNHFVHQTTDACQNVNGWPMGLMG